MPTNERKPLSGICDIDVYVANSGEFTHNGWRMEIRAKSDDRVLAEFFADGIFDANGFRFANDLN